MGDSEPSRRRRRSLPGQCPFAAPSGELPRPRAATRLPLAAPDNLPAANDPPPAAAQCAREFPERLRSREHLVIKVVLFKPSNKWFNSTMPHGCKEEGLKP